ncbi:MAG: 2-oxo acid dehydrogenase subunit E2 [Actinobacteria bacterium]|nr:2-oxo acid dehydrogenase subunit E2 [Actinomycetota bacterium]
MCRTSKRPSSDCPPGDERGRCEMTSIRMPQLGETIVEGTILKWLKAEGEAIERDEPLFELSTDKVDTEVPSPVSGTVTKILVAEGATVAVGTELALVQESGAAAVAAPPEAVAAPEVPSVGASAPPEAVAAPATAAADRGPRSQILSPLVRRLAAEHGIDLSQVRGSGTGGRITKSDVQAAIAGGGAGASVGTSTAAATPALRPVPAPAPPPASEEVLPMSHIRKTIAQHMLASVQTSARAWTTVEVNVENLVRLRSRAKEAFEQKHGVKLTYLPFVVRATIDALQAFPYVNARLDGEDIVLHRYVNMGIAVSYDQGLIVPVIKGADGMNSVGISRAIADLAARARSHELKPDEVTGATFTITNPGPYGSLISVPIINQPNTAILSLDAIQKRPVVVEGDAIAVRSMVYVSMTWDHRVIDGEVATRFLSRVKQNLEGWDFSEDLGI